MSKVWFTLFFCGLLLAAFVVGCSDDDKTTTPTTSGGTANSLEIVDVTQIIEQAAPPEFVAPDAMPSDVDSLWLYGQSPLLNAVFGSVEPEALYSNIDCFRMFMGIVTAVAEVDEDGHIVAGTHVDSLTTDVDEQEITLHYTATVTAIDGPVATQTVAQQVMGDSIDVDFVISIAVDEFPEASVAVGVNLTPSTQTIWQWDSGMGDPTDTQSRLIYSSLDLSDSTFVFKGVGYCLHADDDLFKYAFNINSEASSQFAYRMSYYSNGSGYPDFLHCVIGGGNRDQEFALKYRMFSPADTSVCDSANMLDQVFGPNYTEGSGLISSYEEYLGDELLFSYDAIPNVMLVNPWAE